MMASHGHVERIAIISSIVSSLR